ncbi:MAG: hypothetical protein AB8B56_18350 [Crocinitomicaceae bacterium]
MNYLSRGYIELENSGVSVTNKNRTPNQAMMVFPTLADFMRGLHDIEMGDKRRYVLQGAGSSFELKFESLKGERVIVSEGKTKLFTCRLADLARELWIAYTNLFSKYDFTSLDDLGELNSDLRMEALNFEVAFAYALKDS